ncbi:MAG: putative molybdenum carrier protein [Desulfosarcina sp.]|jgi:hypothetical protein
MIDKIISNGQSVPAVAALDVAIKLGISHHGWCRAGQSAAEKYQIEAIADHDHQSAEYRCVAAADGSLFFTRQTQPSLAYLSVNKTALQMNKPFLALNLTVKNGFSASRMIAGWIVDNQIKALHVDGDIDRHHGDSAGLRVANILEATFFLCLADTRLVSPLSSVAARERFPNPQAPPKSISEAVSHLERSLSLKDRTTIANMVADELVSLQFTVGNYINSQFKLFSTNRALLSDCRHVSGRWDLAPTDAAAVIIRALWDRLRATCRIRIVK